MPVPNAPQQDAEQDDILGDLNTELKSLLEPEEK